MRRGPSWWYSSSVFFSPTLKPSVCSGTSSSSWWALAMAGVREVGSSVGGTEGGRYIGVGSKKEKVQVRV
jgi:hypothetical protein